MGSVAAVCSLSIQHLGHPGCQLFQKKKDVKLPQTDWTYNDVIMPAAPSVMQVRLVTSVHTDRPVVQPLSTTGPEPDASPMRNRRRSGTQVASPLLASFS